MDEFSYEPYVWKGALGGILGNMLAIIIGVIYIWTRFGWEYGARDLLLVGWLLSLLSGPIAGVAIGFIIWKVVGKIGKEPKTIVRCSIGAGVLILYSLLTNLTKAEPWHPAFILMYSITVGGMSGLLAKSKKVINS
jgi:hypothetical protein